MAYRDTLESELAKLKAENLALREELETYKQRERDAEAKILKTLEKRHAATSTRFPLPRTAHKSGGSFLDWFR